MRLASQHLQWRFQCLYFTENGRVLVGTSLTTWIHRTYVFYLPPISTTTVIFTTTIIPLYFTRVVRSCPSDVLVSSVAPVTRSHVTVFIAKRVAVRPDS